MCVGCFLEELTWRLSTRYVTVCLICDFTVFFIRSSWTMQYLNIKLYRLFLWNLLVISMCSKTITKYVRPFEFSFSTRLTFSKIYTQFSLDASLCNESVLTYSVYIYLRLIKANEERWDSKYILFKNMKLLIYLSLTLWRVKANSIPQLYVMFSVLNTTPNKIHLWKWTAVKIFMKNLYP